MKCSLLLNNETIGPVPTWTSVPFVFVNMPVARSKPGSLKFIKETLIPRVGARTRASKLGAPALAPFEIGESVRDTGRRREVHVS